MKTRPHAKRAQPRLTFEKVWAMFQETDKKFQESKAEHDRIIAETNKQFQETDKKFQESKAEHDRIIAETNKQFQETDKKFQETDKQFQESKAEHDRIIAETNKQFQETDKKFQETDKKFQESKAEHDRMIAETKAEHDRMIAETNKQVKEASKIVGGLGNSLGDFAEGLMASDLYETFKALGLDFDQFTGNYKLKERKTKRTLTEVDMLLINGTIAMIVEVKTNLTRGDVDKHIQRMEILRNTPNSMFANRKMYGAMASIKTSKLARHYAAGKGFFVIELSGNAIKINMPEGFEPKTW
jgi:hypothetical protein